MKIQGKMINGSFTVNQILAAALDLPENTTKAILLMRAGQSPLLRVTTVLTSADSAKTMTETFALERRKVGAGETATEGHNASLEGRAAFGASARSDCCASNGNYEERTDK